MSGPIRRLALALRGSSANADLRAPRRAPRLSFGQTVGIGISAGSVRAVGVSGDAIRWAIELERNEGEPLSETVSALIERSPIGRRAASARPYTGAQTSSGLAAGWRLPRPWPAARWLRPKVVVAVGSSAVQVKRLTGLPPLTDAASLEAVVREGAGRFFLKNGVPLVTTAVRVVEPGTVWAAAFEASVIDEIERACAATDLRLQAIVPAAAALAFAVEPPAAASGERIVPMVWTDGDVRMEVTFSEGRIESLRRLPSEHSSDRHCTGGIAGSGPALAEALHKLGERSLTFADAYGATRTAGRLGRNEPLVLRAGSGAGGSPLLSEPSRSRLVAAVSAFLVASACAVAGPPLIATRSTHAARARLTSMAKQVAQAESRETELSRVSRALAEVARFQGSRRSTTALLADLTRALPKEAALVALDVDSVGGTIVALGARASQITAALEKVKEIASPEIVGPVTRERAGNREVERLTVRFRFAR